MSRTVKIKEMGLSDRDKAKLVKISKTATEQARKVRRAKILVFCNSKFPSFAEPLISPQGEEF